MKLKFTFTNGEDLTKVDKDDIYHTYFVLPDEILELPDAHQQVLQISESIDLVIVAYLFVTCDELEWHNLPIRHPNAKGKRFDLDDFASGSKLQFHNRAARKKRDKYKTLQTLGGGFGNRIADAYKLAEDILQLLKTDSNPWRIYKVKSHFRDNRIVNMFNRRVKARIKADKKREREAAKKAKLEAETTKPKQGQVYFIQQGDAGPIKIGYSTNPEKRLKTLSTASPYPLHLRLVIEGGKKLEKDLHDQFAEHQLDGEWFEANASLLTFIDEQKLDSQ